ncbi:MAG: hypothetical protein K8Q91_01575 [Candidatus Vogelbacteria bacterium]|nr:hypothetical protein [Candidatus Vogelbacteria bacterium]
MSIFSLWDTYLDLLPKILPFFYYLSPLISCLIIWRLYLYYIRYGFVKKMDWVLLEIKMPKEISKTPSGMEIIFSNLHQTGGGSLIDKFIKGKVRSWFSLEMCSFGGDVKFFVRLEKKFRDLFEAAAYSQYPEIEIHEAEDYVHKIPYGVVEAKWDMWGAVLKFTKADPYPIKTYIDYGLDKKEKDALVSVDPLTPIIEFLGSVKPGEQVWVQIPIMAARDLKQKPGGKWYEKEGWKKEGEALVNDIMKRDAKTKASKQLSATGFPIIPSLSKGEQDVIEAIERSISKLGFEAGIRMIYFAPEGKINNNYKGAILSMFKQFNSQNLNGFDREFDTSFDYPWQDFMGLRLAKMKADLFNSYRLRSLFWMPYPSKTFVLNTEELATLFHFPGAISQTPTFGRIMSKRAEPPPNLPV